MPKQAAGILLYRFTNGNVEVFLCHPGGPFYQNKDNGVWAIPKGEFTSDEEPLAAAKREFFEETGQQVTGRFIAMDPVKNKSGKTTFAFMVEGDVDAGNIKSNEFEMEWPPKSGKFISVPEMDRAGWFTLTQAKEKILPSLLPLLQQLAARIP